MHFQSLMEDHSGHARYIAILFIVYELKTKMLSTVGRSESCDCVSKKMRIVQLFGDFAGN